MASKILNTCAIVAALTSVSLVTTSAFATPFGLKHSIQNPQGSRGVFGASPSIDGNLLVVGAPHRPGTRVGQAFLFDASSGALLQTINSPEPSTNDQFGGGSDISNGKMVFGSYLGDLGGTDTGSAYVYDTSTGNLLHSLQSPTPTANDWFAQSVAISDKYVIIGEQHDGTAGIDSGALHVFDVNSGAHLNTITNPSPDSGDSFGAGFTIDGEDIYIGAHRDDTTATDSGIVYRFDATSGNLLQTFTNPDAAPGDSFGAQISVSNGRILIAASDSDVGGVDSGTAFLFDLATGNLVNRFDNPVSGTDSEFARSIALSGDEVLIGAINDDTNGVDSGAAYLFDAITGSLLQTFLNPYPAAGDQFGSVAISGDLIVIGAQQDQGTGAVHVYERGYEAPPGPAAIPAPASVSLIGLGMLVLFRFAGETVAKAKRA